MDITYITQIKIWMKLHPWFPNFGLQTAKLEIFNLEWFTYMPSQPHLVGDTRIFVFSPTLKTLTRFNQHFA